MLISISIIKAELDWRTKHLSLRQQQMLSRYLYGCILSQNRHKM